MCRKAQNRGTEGFPGLLPEHNLTVTFDFDKFYFSLAYLIVL